jgi:hypothetical protein
MLAPDVVEEEHQSPPGHWDKEYRVKPSTFL